MDEKWNLSIGCHKNTITSRDSYQVELDSLEACKKHVADTAQSINYIRGHLTGANAQ